MNDGNERRAFNGPKCWVVCFLSGLMVGYLVTGVLPAPAALANGKPDVQVYLAVPFALLLLSIALMPFINPKFWEHHYPDFALFLGGTVIAFYLAGLRTFLIIGSPYGLERMKHIGLDYFQFIALIGSLYVVTGGILIDIKGKGTPLVNSAILATGAVVANLFGTTGAAALLIRPYIRINRHRIQSFHILLFIFVVANCGGCLTPIGDPPLFIGYLQGVPFTWTLTHCLPAWAVAVGLLVAVFFVMDTRAYRARREERSAPAGEKTAVSIAGWRNFLFLALVLFGVFLDRMLERWRLPHLPYGSILQIIAALAAHKLSNPENLKANEFTFGPIKEVGLLFFGIFATMVPALDYLSNNAAAMMVASPTDFYFASGSLSSFLDNAPTYYTFLSAAHGLAGLEVGKDTVAWMGLQNVGGTGFTAERILLAISLGSVFFGANTYIGNGPNFMVKAISEAAGVPMPSFFGYIVRYTIPILLPIFVVVWLILVR